MINMPRKSSKQLNLAMDDEEDDDSDDDQMTAEEAQLRAARLQRELEEQNKFDCLCDGVTGAISLVDSAFNNLLELKDELLVHDLPPSLLASIVLITGKLYRSITDLHTPVRELTRLVSVYSVPWEQKSEQLKKLHTDYESKQRQLNLAIRKLQLIDSAARRMEREKIVNNWEKLFSKVSATKSHGRRWKFMIESFKKKVQDGVLPDNWDAFDLDDDDDDSADEEDVVDEQPPVDGKRFMMSVITASPPQEDDTGSQPAAFELGSEADGVPSEVTESYENPDEMSPDLQLKPKRQGVSFGPVSENQHVSKPIFKPEVKDASSWTDEPEYETLLAIRTFRPLELEGEEGQSISCSLTIGGKTIKTGLLPKPVPADDPQDKEKQPKSPEVASTQKPGSKASRRKSIGFADTQEAPPTTPSRVGMGKPSSILKKRSSAEDDLEGKAERLADNPVFLQSDFKEVFFPLPQDMEEMLKINVLQEEDNRLISAIVLPLGDIDIQELPVRYAEDMEQPNTSESTERAENGLFMLKLRGLKPDSDLGKLPLKLYVVKKEITKFEEKGVGTESMRDLIMDVTGVDIEEIAKEELVGILSREYQDVCTSAMSFASSASTHKSGLISQEELEAMQEQHDKELRNIQAEYEIKLQQLMVEMEERQKLEFQGVTQRHVEYTSATDHGVNTTQILEGVEMIPAHEGVHFAQAISSPELTPIKKQRKSVLPDWGAHLPKNVWVRMKMLTDEMFEKRQQLEARTRRQIANNIEKKLASQYKLQRSNITLRGPLQDVSLPAVFMPSKTGNVYNPRAHMYFHPTGTSNYLRLSQPPSIFQLPPLPEKARLSVVNLFDLNKNFQQNASSDWLSKIAAASQGKASRATTAATRVSRLATPNTPAPTANIPSFDVK